MIEAYNGSAEAAVRAGGPLDREDTEWAIALVASSSLSCLSPQLPPSFPLVLFHRLSHGIYSAHTMVPGA